MTLVGALASAALIGLAARLESPLHLLAFVVLVPWLMGLERARSVWAALLSGVVMAMAMAATVFWWFPRRSPPTPVARTPSPG